MSNKRFLTENMFTDEDEIDSFLSGLDINGVAAVASDDGIIVAFTADMLKTLLDKANDNSDEKLVIFIGNEPIDRGVLN